MTREAAQAKAKAYMDWLGAHQGNRGRLTDEQLVEVSVLYDEAVNAVCAIAPGLRLIVDHFKDNAASSQGVQDAIKVYQVLEAAAGGRW